MIKKINKRNFKATGMSSLNKLPHPLTLLNYPSTHLNNFKGVTKSIVQPLPLLEKFKGVVKSIGHPLSLLNKFMGVAK